MRISLDVQLPSGARKPFSHQGNALRMGRSSACDWRCTDDEAKTVSWEHAEVVFEQQNAYLRDLGSSNGTFCNGNRVTGKQLLRVGDEIRLGQHGPKLTVSALEFDAGQEAIPGTAATGEGGELTIELDVLDSAGSSYPLRYTGRQFRLGRDPAGELSFSGKAGKSVSWSHAQLIVERGTVFVTDVGSLNGTYVNGQRIDVKRELRVGDQIGLGQQGPKLTVRELQIQQAVAEGKSAGAAGPFGYLGAEDPPPRPGGGLSEVLVVDELAGFPPRWQPGDSARDRADVPPCPVPGAAEKESTRALLLDFSRRQQQRWMVAGGIAAALALVGLAGFLVLSYLRSDADDMRRLLAHVEASVVVIETSGEEGTGLGSGFVFDRRGTIVTNYHVIQGATSARVVFRDGRFADVIGFTAVAPGKDLAFLRIDPSDGLPRPLPLAPNPPEKLTTVVAFGAPQGLRGSVSVGVVSAVRTGTEVADTLQLGEVDLYRQGLGYEDDAIWVQTSATIIKGNSGGPLVNAAGQVVGINTWGPPDLHALVQSLEHGATPEPRKFETLNFASSAENIKQLQQSASPQVKSLSELP